MERALAAADEHGIQDDHPALAGIDGELHTSFDHAWKFREHAEVPIFSFQEFLADIIEYPEEDDVANGRRHGTRLSRRAPTTGCSLVARVRSRGWRSREWLS